MIVVYLLVEEELKEKEKSIEESAAGIKIMKILCLFISFFF